jgi:hypothetical protein
MDPETQRAYVAISVEIFERLISGAEERFEEAAFPRIAKKNAKARLLEDE